MINKIPKDVNESQWQAICHDGSHLLIVAGPGTGKTHTLTYRIARLAEQLNVGQRILSITFTNKATEEMQKRLEKKFPGIESRVCVTTFHGFCLQLLRDHADLNHLPKDFKVATPEEIDLLIKELWMDKSAGERKNILNDISRYKALVTKDSGVCLDQYNSFLRARGFIDFDDLLTQALNLLQHNEETLKQTQLSYPFIFVDEYQDINPIQHELLKILVTDNVHITAIGDPNQAIYGFRGSDVRFFESFVKDFPQAQKYFLSENYRSTANLLEASTQVISKNNFGVPALTAHLYDQGQLTIYEASTDKAEAEYVVHQIEKMVGGTSMFSQDSNRVTNDQKADYSFGDIVILYRLNALRNILEKAFLRSGIPFQVSGNKPHACDDPFVRQAEKVNLMTIHAAKGLEFPVVFMIGCEEHLLPLCLPGLESDHEEELRLFYVGMTRAKEKLYFTRAQRRALFGKISHPAPSIYLEDIKEELKQYEKQEHHSKFNSAKNEAIQLTLFK